MKKKLFLGIALVFILIQFIPYGKDHENPVIVNEPVWSSVRTKEFFSRACMDCHSYETKWPWYSKVAPVSWPIYHHVKEGREHFNVSLWGVQKKNEAEEAAEELKEGHMPLKTYRIAHPEARLSKQEKEEFIRGLIATFGEESETSNDD